MQSGNMETGNMQPAGNMQPGNIQPGNMAIGINFYVGQVLRRIYLTDLFPHPFPPF